jgi:hypothetical protein
MKFYLNSRKKVIMIAQNISTVQGRTAVGNAPKETCNMLIYNISTPTLPRKISVSEEIFHTEMQKIERVPDFISGVPKIFSGVPNFILGVPKIFSGVPNFRFGEARQSSLMCRVCMVSNQIYIYV